MTELLRRRSASVILLIAATFLVLPVAALAAAGATVAVTDDAYDDGTEDPARTVVEAGETVTWRWSADNSNLHTVTALDGSFDSDSACEEGSTAPCRGPGNVFEVRFDEPGTYHYRCRLVLTMTGTVEVTESDGGVEPPGPEPAPEEPPAQDGDEPQEQPDGGEDGTSEPEDGAAEGDSAQEPDDADGEGEADGAEPEPDDSGQGDASPAPTAAAGETSSPAPRRGMARARQLPQLRSEGADAGGHEAGDDPDVAPPVDRPSFEPFPEPTPAEDDELAAMAVEIPGTPDGPSRAIVTGAAVVSLLVSAGAVTKVVLGGMAA